jgi:hypothetical protein
MTFQHWPLISLTLSVPYLRYAFFAHRLYSPCSCNVAILLIVWLLCFCRAINSLFLVLLYQRKDLFRLILFLLHPKPPRLRKVRTEMMSKIHWKELARPRCLILHTQKTLVLIGRGNVSRSSFLRVPPLLRLLSWSLLLPMRMRNFSTS